MSDAELIIGVKISGGLRRIQRVNEMKTHICLAVLLLTLLAGCASGGEVPAAPTPPPAETAPVVTAPMETAPIETAPAETPAVLPLAITAAPVEGSGQVFLYGEWHGDPVLYATELELWKGYYGQGLRHLFIEYPYYTAEYLNLWMQAEDDVILDELYRDWAGSAAQNGDNKAFLQAIKEQCPETVFHGTDVGHQYRTTGARYMSYLRENGLEDSAAYRLAEEVCGQGARYYSGQDDTYRENTMAENFIRAFDLLEGESVMGIYGGAHTDIDAMNYGTGEVPALAGQLYQRYGDANQTVDLTQVPRRVDILTVNGKEYRASYFGEQDISHFSDDFVSRSFWRLEGAYADFKDCPKTGDVLPYHNYPAGVEAEQVYVIDYTQTDGTVTRSYYRSDGNEWNGLPATEEFTLP